MRRVTRRLALVHKRIHRAIIAAIMAGDRCSREGAEQRYSLMSVEERLRLRHCVLIEIRREKPGLERGVIPHAPYGRGPFAGAGRPRLAAR